MQRCSGHYCVDGHVQRARKGEEMEEDIDQSGETEVQGDREQSHVGEGRELSPQEDRGPPNQTLENPAIVRRTRD